MKKKVSLLLVGAILLSASFTSNALSSVTEIISNETTSSKFIELFDIDSNEFKQFSLNQSSNEENDSYISALIEFDYPTIDLSELEDLSRRERRDALEEYYKPLNEKIVENLDIEGCVVSYFGPYAEIAYDTVSEYVAEREELINISEKKTEIDNISVDMIDLSEPEVVSVESSGNYPLSTAYNDIGIQTNQYTGEGFKVGLLEAGIPMNNIPSSKIHANNPNAVYDDHCDCVANVIGGTYGIVSDVEFYCFDLGYLSNITNGFNYLIGESDVDIINASFGLGNTGTYNYISAYIDYITITTDCLLVKSAGNDGDTNIITIPGMSINALTVGSSNAAKEVSSFSSYVDITEKILKPEVVAPGEVVSGIGGTRDAVSGTSISAPMVVGIAVKLMQEFPALRNDSAFLKSIIMAGAERLSSSYDWLDDEAGLGLVNYTKSREIMQNTAYGSYVKDLENMKIGRKIYESEISIASMKVADIDFSRMVYGENCTPSASEKTPEMTSYRVVLRYNMPGVNYIVKDFIWNDSIANVRYANAFSTSINCIIEIYIAESDENPVEKVMVAYSGASHKHLYTARKTVQSNLYHYSYCTCGTYILEQHSYPEDTGTQRYCTECNYPEGFMSN